MNLKVMFSFLKEKKLSYCKKQKTDKEGRILILDVSMNDSEYILINLYITPTLKKDQIDNQTTCSYY